MWDSPRFMFLSAVGKALKVDDTDILKLRKERVHSSTESNTGKDAGKGKTGRSNSFDDHDEICEVCEKGGDLLCCDTCTLVFHLRCIRPKLQTVPKGKWSCPYCVIDVSANFILVLNTVMPINTYKKNYYQIISYTI